MSPIYTVRGYRTRSALLLIPVLLSAVVLFWNLPTLGLSHWDEYNYLETAEWFLRKPGAAFTIYEPPGFSFLVAVFFRLFGVQDYVAIAVSIVFAVATVALVAYVGLRYFGLSVGLASPILLLIMPLFITYSRMALTDVAFTFFYSLAMVTMYAAVKRRRRGDIIVSGLALGACAMIKYNGFMPLIVFLIYGLVALWNVGDGKRLAVTLRSFQILIFTCIPALVLGLLFIAFLGLSAELPTRRVFSLHAMKILVLQAPTVLAKGLVKFMKAAVFYHSGQLAFIPFAHTPFYIEVLAFFVPTPVLVLAIIGIARRNMRDGADLFAAVWLLGSFFVVASFGAEYSRAILPTLPPLALCAGLGLIKLVAYLQSLSFPRPRLRLRVLTPLLLILVVVLSLPGAYQAISIEHHGYRQAAEVLGTVQAKGSVLADSQPVIRFYTPVTFGQINDTTLSTNQYLVVDFVAAENGYMPRIQQLTEEGHLKLLATVPADLPTEVYLDSISFNQLAEWNYTYIQVYQIVNATAPTPST